MQPIMAYLMRESELLPFLRVIRINVDPYDFPVFLKNEPADIVLQWSTHDFQTKLLRNLLRINRHGQMPIR